jgi:predicted RNA binding protein YcfA (HicA-like mRNA interferase family)
MSKFPRITSKELLRALLRDGFEVARQKGSHVQVRKFVDGEKITFPVPVHAGKTVKIGTLKGILRKAKISEERLIELL